MLNRTGLRLVGIDSLDHEDLEPEPPAPISFAKYAAMIDRGFSATPVDAVQFTLGALNDVARRFEDLARELGRADSSPDDTDRPRAA